MEPPRPSSQRYIRAWRGITTIELLKEHWAVEDARKARRAERAAARAAARCERAAVRKAAAAPPGGGAAARAPAAAPAGDDAAPADDDAGGGSFVGELLEATCTRRDEVRSPCCAEKKSDERVSCQACASLTTTSNRARIAAGRGPRRVPACPRRRRSRRAGEGGGASAAAERDDGRRATRDGDGG